MKRLFPLEFVYQLFALLIAVVLVHGIYATWIRPQAALALDAQRQMIAQDPTVEAPQSLYVILRDYEQEVCFILFLWAIAIIAYKGVHVMGERRLLAAGTIVAGIAYGLIALIDGYLALAVLLLLAGLGSGVLSSLSDSMVPDRAIARFNTIGRAR